jgi:hypothetical protein
MVGTVWSGNNWPRSAGEAAQTITGECERLFCDALSVVFLGERSRRQGPLVMGAYYRDYQPNRVKDDHKRVENWIELWHYANDTIYRGFVANGIDGVTLFVFFEDYAPDHCLKSG